MLTTAAPHSTPWLPKGYAQSVRHEAARYEWKHREEDRLMSKV
jgi:hypothetical protein